jgi:phosphomannomutase
MLGKVFKAYDVRGKVPKPLNERIAWKIGHGTADFLLEEGVVTGRTDPMSRTIVVGRDARESSPGLSEALCTGMRDRGASVIDIGLVDTPMVTFAVNYLDCGGGVQVTASHNPAGYNGFKFSRAKGRPIGSGTGLESIRDRSAVADPVRVVPAGGFLESRDLWEPNTARIHTHLAADVPAGLTAVRGRPLRVVVDASNGAAGEMVSRIFKNIDGLELIELNFDHTIGFKHDPNPLVESNLDELREAVRSEGADAGVCFDGDADRCVVVDESGRTIGGDLLTVWLAESILGDAPKGKSVIYDLRSSRVLSERIEALGARPIPCRVGHVFMKQALADTHALFGGELSGHFYYKDMFNADSGARAFVSVLAGLAGSDRPLSESIEPFRKYVQSGEINFECEDIEEAFEALKATYPDADMMEMDGLSLDTGSWWANVRASNTEPLLRLNIETLSKDELDAALKEIGPLLGRRVEH